MRRRPTATYLTLPEIARWTLAPQTGMAELLSLGRIEVEALCTLDTLALLIHTLHDNAPPPASAIGAILRLTASIRAGAAIDEDEVAAAQAWLANCARRCGARKGPTTRLRCGDWRRVSRKRPTRTANLVNALPP